MKKVLNSIDTQSSGILAVIITAVLKFIMIDWLYLRAVYISGICIFWSVFVLLHVRRNSDMLNLWGFTRTNFKQSLYYLLPLIILSIMASVLYASIQNSFHFTWHIIPVLFLYPLWGTVQQFVMLSILLNQLITHFEVKLNRYIAIPVVSVLFCLIHYSSPFLMIFTFFMEVVFATLFLKWRNLWAIGLAHGWIYTFILFYILERDLWAELFSIF